MNNTIKGISVREALTKWEEKTGLKASEERKIEMYASIPPIDKLDSSLSSLSACEQLSLSTNCIEKITNLNGLKSLKILSLGRNNIKSLAGIEAVGETLEELWISYNQIEKLKGINALKKLKVLYMSNNLIKDWSEFQKLADLTCLENLLLIGNPLEEKHSQDGDWKDQVAMRLKRLKKLDGAPVIREDDQDENVD